MLENTEGAIKNGQSRETGNTKGQSKMDNPEKTGSTGHTRRRQTKTKILHNMCWTPQNANKHKKRK